MEKRKAHCALAVVISVVRQRGAAAFTKTALDGGRQMGLTSAKMIEVVCGLSGFRCPACGEIEFEPDSAERYAAAGDALVLAARKAAGMELRRIRKALGLNQAEAARLTGGGHNAFSRYETGKIAPAPAVINLFRLLERHPEEKDELLRA